MRKWSFILCHTCSCADIALHPLVLHACRVKVNPAHQFLCSTCKSACDRLAEAHSTANGKEGLIRALSPLPLTLGIVHDVQFLPEAEVWPAEAGGSDSAKRIDIVVQVRTSDSNLHLFAVELLNRQVTAHRPLHAHTQCCLLPHIMGACHCSQDRSV